MWLLSHPFLALLCIIDGCGLHLSGSTSAGRHCIGKRLEESMNFEVSVFLLPYPLWEKAMATHSSILAWKIPWMEEPGRLYSPWGLEELDTNERLHFHFSLSCIGEGNGNPLQCSCLENPRNREAWWAAISRVTQSWT